MTDITSLSIPKQLITDAKNLKINCSDVARTAIEKAIESKKKNVVPDPAPGA